MRPFTDQASLALTAWWSDSGTLQNSTQLEATKRVQKLRSQIQQLDAIFKNNHANWWKAFKQGPLTFWIPYFFTGDEIGLWQAVDSHISDLLENEVTDEAQYTGEIKKELETLEAKLNGTRIKFRVQEQANKSLQNIAKRPRKMPNRLQIELKKQEESDAKPSTE